MKDFDAVDALLAGVAPEAELPAPEERVRLRETARLTKAQVARALGVSPTTLAAWESGREPAGETRTRYAYLLDGLSAKLDAPAEEPAPPDPTPPSSPTPFSVPASPSVAVATGPGGGVAEGDELAVPQPCVLCGHPARHEVEGFAQHLDPAECGGAAPTPRDREGGEPAPPPGDREGGESASPPGGRERPERARSQGKRFERERPKADRAASAARLRAFQEPAPTPLGTVQEAVREALVRHGGDTEAATADLVRTAIPDAMALLDMCRTGARYEIVGHPPLPGILRKKTSRGADEVWEARPKWTRPALPAGLQEITALDINGAYLSALKTHLPLGALEHHTGGVHDRRRAGVHLVTPPDWQHGEHLPNPLGSRDEPGPLWITEPTLRLLLRLSSPAYGLCEPPVVHESFTSGATENLLEKFRNTLRDARAAALVSEDEVTLEYVKAMYSKFVATMGESNFNRELYRPDWMHIIRSQAFANLWTKAYKAYEGGLTVVRAMGTDELHVIGDWRRVFPEGRGVSEVKVKDVYTAQEEG
ncbi:helix-turn-helix transcriptional regulator [Streptomyces sp. SR27]|uniref:helix-turn-helix domain-containing protein n=1 Tax=Streptomyces sp. SR27 TaxID=3076630 RepID=UPI00295A60B1|nr:helix-turn-helix transcriptional regulator [Streptomyces sp. SR27]MDV9189404.1 helix-turn-helix transcriptional regulator [Streptomyces sp. SR27]